MLDRLMLVTCLVCAVVFGLMEDFVWMAISAAAAIVSLTYIHRSAGGAALVAAVTGVVLLLNEHVLASLAFLLAMVVLAFLAIPAKQQPARP